jgi:hypothetical protein
VTRQDLLALSVEDLVAFSNRGTVNRAAKEAASAELSCALEESPDGTVRGAWSDGWTVELPGGQTLAKARCSCLAVGVCRHVVRTVLRYAQRARAPAAAEPWDPGAIPDAELERHLPAAALADARRRVDAGLLVELVRGPKPLAHFHGLSVNVRFRVPGDVGYAAADCAPALAPVMVALAVWAFRRLPPEAASGFVVTGAAAPAPVPELDALDAACRDWFMHGLGGASPHWLDDLRRLEKRCLAAGLVWPAHNVASFAEEAARYAAHDALFDPERALAAAGELLARTDALRAATGAVPLPLVRGTAEDHEVELAAARLLGVGCGVVARTKSTTLSGYFVDLDSGVVAAIARERAEAAGGAKAAEAPPPFHREAAAPVLQGVALGQLARAQLLVAKAKRTASGRLSFGRTRATVTPQAFAWEQLREPVLVDDLDELRQRLSLLPPTALRSLRASDGFHVLAVTGAEGAVFDGARQAVRATLRDAAGQAATLLHPFSSRAAEGCELLLAKLGAAPVRFVAGHVRLAPSGVVIAPTAVVFQEGATRTAVLPWVDRAGAVAAEATVGAAHEAAPVAPLARHLGELGAATAALLQTGLRRPDERTARQLRELAAAGEAVGLGHLPALTSRVAGELERRLRDPAWSAAPAAEACCELAALIRLAADLL